jgi:hypothetical protein
MGIQSIFVGERFQNRLGKWFSVIGYITGKKIVVKFDESGYECIVEGQEIRRKCIVDSIDKYPTIGDKHTMNQNGILEVLEYNNAENVVVRFLSTGFTTTVEACQIRRGTVKDLLLPRVCGVGYIGEGRYSAYNSRHEAHWSYLKWQNMLERCYAPTSEQTRECYEDVTVCDEWFNYQIFAEWAVNQIGYGNRGWAMEKDLLAKGNRHYSPDKCCFLPVELNNQMLKAEKVRGEYPIGVCINKPNGRFIAHCTKEGESSTHIGIYDTVIEAFEAYRQAKKDRLRFLAEKWKDKIDQRAYQALLNYDVSITD